MQWYKAAILAGATVFALTSTALAQDLKIEVMTNWVSGGESAALNALASIYEKNGGTWVDNAVATDQNAAAITRIVGGKPMAAAKFNTGTDMDELYSAGLLSDITSVAESHNWEKRIPSFVWDAIRRDGKVYAAPINLQSEVWLWYSKAVFEKSGAKVPTTYDELFVALDTMKAAGYVPLAVSGQSNWLAILFYKILAGVAPDVYLQLQTHDYETALKSDGFKRAADIFGRLRAYSDAGSPGRTWNAAVNMVVSDQAGMVVMGDWAKGEFTAAGKKAGVDYGCMLGPENEAVILSGDDFIFPKDETVRKGQQLLASILLEQETQVAFNKAKGSIPVTLDTDVSTLDACTQKAMAVLQDPAKRLPSNSFLLSADRRQGLITAIAQYWSNEKATPSALADAMLQAYRSTE